MLFELEVFELPPIRKHIGPPVDEWQHAEKFYNLHTSLGNRVYIKGGRYYVNLPRRFRYADELIINQMHMCSLGKQLKEYLPTHAKILSGWDMLQLSRVFFVED